MTAKSSPAPTAPQSAMPVVLGVAATMALSIMSDSLLYGILPLEAANLGISLPQVGILLSANRLIRLFSNTWASTIYERFGPRLPYIGAAILGVIAPILYGRGWGFTTLLVARIIWGMGWSALRQGGYQAIWAAGDQIKGRMSGILWGVVRMGSALGVLCGGYLYDQYNFTIAIGAAIVMAILAVPVASLIRWPMSANISSRGSGEQQKDHPGSSWLTSMEKPAHRWLLGATFFDLLLNSIVIATTSLFLAEKLAEDQSGLTLGIGIATATGLLHGVRWLANLAVGPLLGHLSDQWGQPQTASVLGCVLILCLLGAVTLPAILAITSLALAFLAKGSTYVVLSAAAAGTATQTQRPHLFMSMYATASDAGSAIGPLFAFSAAGLVGFPALYLSVGLVFGLILFRYRYHAR